MANWRKVTFKAWSSRSFVALTERAQLVFMNIITHPNLIASLGIMNEPVESLAVKLKSENKPTPIQRYRKAFGQLEKAGCIEYDHDLHVLAIPNHFKHNPPDSHKNVIRAVRDASNLPQSPVVTRQLLRLKGFVESRGEAWTNPIDGALDGASMGHHMPHGMQLEEELEQETDSEVEQETDFICPPPAVNGGKKAAETKMLLERFRHWYAIYPKHRKRKDAEKAWLALAPSDQLARTIYRETKRRAKHDPEWLKDGGQYVPLPAGYIRSAMWEDEWQPSNPRETDPNVKIRAEVDATNEYLDAIKRGAPIENDSATPTSDIVKQFIPSTGASDDPRTT